MAGTTCTGLRVDTATVCVSDAGRQWLVLLAVGVRRSIQTPAGHPELAGDRQRSGEPEGTAAQRRQDDRHGDTQGKQSTTLLYPVPESHPQCHVCCVVWSAMLTA